MLPEVAAAFDALARDAMLDPALRAGSATAGIVVTLVGMQLAGPMTRPAALAPHGRNGVEQRLEHPAVMDVGAGQAQRNAAAVGDDVALGPWAPATGGVRPGDLAPLFAAMDALSRQARLQSRRPARCKWRSKARCSRSQTSANCQSPQPPPACYARAAAQFHRQHAPGNAASEDKEDPSQGRTI